jgi:hypothetical protein
MILVDILIWCIFAYFTAWLAVRKGYLPHIGILGAIFLGPVALIIAALAPTTAAGREMEAVDLEIRRDSPYQDRVKTCPACAREVGFTCRVCPRCEHRFADAAVQ